MVVRIQSMSFLIYCICYLYYFNSSSQYKIEGLVKINATKNELVLNTYVSININKFNSQIDENGGFSFTNIPKGVYIISVLSPNYIFESKKVEIMSNGIIECYSIDINNPIKLLTTSCQLLFEPVSSFHTNNDYNLNLWSIVSNPMFIFAVLPVFAMFLSNKVNDLVEEEKKMQQIDNGDNETNSLEKSEQLKTFDQLYTELKQRISQSNNKFH